MNISKKTLQIYGGSDFNLDCSISNVLRLTKALGEYESVFSEIITQILRSGLQISCRLTVMPVQLPIHEKKLKKKNNRQRALAVDQHTEDIFSITYCGVLYLLW